MPLYSDADVTRARDLPIREVWNSLGLPPYSSKGKVKSPWRPQETIPSVEVGGDKNIVHDYGSNDTLGTIELVRRVKNITFPEAVEFLLGKKPDAAAGNGSHQKAAKPDAAPRKIVKTYDYTDEAGLFLFQVVRYEPKDFRQRRKGTDGKWLWNLEGVRRVLYRLPQLKKDLASGATIYFCEGEKDVERLHELGFAATSVPQGSIATILPDGTARIAKAKWSDEFAEILRGVRVVILPDNDAAGKAHAKFVAELLSKTAASVQILALPDLKHKGDVSDWLAAGGTREELQQLAATAPVFTPEKTPAPTPLAATASDCYNSEEKLDPLLIARAVRKNRPNLICLSKDPWDYNGKIYEQIADEVLLKDAIALIGGAAKRNLFAEVKHFLSAAGEAYAPPTFFAEQKPDFIMVQNGALNWRTNELLPHAPEYRARNLFPVAFDPAARCPRFEQALTEWLPDDGEAAWLLKEFMGYCLIPDTRMERALVLVGEGRNGKSVFFELVKRLLGPHNVSGLPLQSLSRERTFPVAALEGKLVNLCGEAEQQQARQASFDEGLFKSLVTGEMVTVERKGRDHFPMYPVARFIILSNNPPYIHDKTNGVWERLMIVRFSRFFAAEDRDVNLIDKLTSELPGIFNFALDGLRSLMARGRFQMTAKMGEEIEDYKRECNPIMTWQEEHLRKKPEEEAMLGELWDAYKKWALASGYHAGSIKTFGKALRRLGMEQAKFRSQSNPLKSDHGFRGWEFLEDGLP